MSIPGKTIGVPLFQEQSMRFAVEAANFSENNADGRRRAMATSGIPAVWRCKANASARAYQLQHRALPRAG